MFILLTSTGLSSFCQDTLVTGKGVPSTLHVNVPVSPSVTLSLRGGVAIDGGTGNKKSIFSYRKVNIT